MCETCLLLKGLPGHRSALHQARDHGVETVRRPGYTLLRQSDGSIAIRCDTCGRISHNPNDVEHAYCAGCHHFHAA
jgi:hypothetical protein